MEQWLDVLTSVITEFIRLFIVGEYCNIFFGKDNQRLKHGIAYICSYLLTACAYNLFHNALLNSVVTFLGLFIISATYSGSWSKKIFFTALIFGISCATDVLAFSIIPNEGTGSSSDIWVFFLSLLLFWLCALACRRYFRFAKEDTVRSYEGSVLLISLTSAGTIYVVLEGADISRLATLLICVLLMVINFSVYYLYEATGTVYKRECENIIFHEQLKAYEKQMALRIENDKKVHSLQHDMKHHLKEISDMALTHRDAEILKYIENMREYMHTPDYIVDTGNISVDGILNYKLEEAKQRGIAVQAHVLLPDTVHIPVFDMNVLFGNLFDNAIEASEKTDNPYIDLNVQYKQECLYINISNNYDGLVREEGGKLISLKEQQSCHGYGLYSVKKVVEKYEGSMEITHSDKIFQVKICLFISGVLN